jgi:hypothetical protein
MRGLPDAPAGLPRRCTPRNDNGGNGTGRGGTRPSFRIYSHNAVIASPLGRGNPVGFVMRNTQTMLSLPYASVGSPRRDFVLLCDDKVKRRGMPNPTLPGRTLSPSLCLCRTGNWVPPLGRPRRTGESSPKSSSGREFPFGRLFAGCR